MTRARLWTTLLVLATGAGMGGLYFQPDQPAAPERIKAESILPQLPARTAAQIADPTAPAPEPAIANVAAAPVEPAPTVALPTGPLLRSATEAPPIDTTAFTPRGPLRSDPALVAPAPTMPRPDAVPQASPLAGVADETALPADLAAPAAQATKRRPRQQAKAPAHSRKVESLFLNPLGVR